MIRRKALGWNRAALECRTKIGPVSVDRAHPDETGDGRCHID
jgi:hypothetical protein